VTSTLNPQFDASLLSRIEDAGLNASAPPQQVWLDGWLVRFSPGKAKRARCVNAVAAGRLSVGARLESCTRIFSEARLPLIVRITPFTLPPELDATLAATGLHRFDDTRVMVLADELRRDLPPGAAVTQGAMTIHSLGLDAFAQRVGGFRGSPLAQRQAHSHRLLNSPVPFFAYELRVDGEPAACGQYALEGDIAGIYDVFTASAARGRGLAGSLCRHLLLEAANRGAKHAYLQVEGDNHAARSVYHRLGFADAYAYHYRARDPSTA
jgi:ribosomal protein S18 acetylase RimI-like enzyme